MGSSALVLDKAHGKEPDMDRLREQRNQFGTDERGSKNIDLAICERGIAACWRATAFAPIEWNPPRAAEEKVRMS